MKKLSAFLLLTILCVCSCEKEEKTNTLTMGDFEMSTDTLTHNKPITITYNGDDKDMEGFYYQLRGNKAYPKDLNFENGKASLTIPDSIAAIALNLKVNGNYLENDKKGYLFPVIDTNGKAIVGSKSSLENYKLGNGQNYGLKGDKEVLAKELQADIEANPELKTIWGTRYLSAIIKADRKKGEIIANNMLAELSSKKEMTEADYVEMNSIYSITRKKELSDSITKLAIAKYPKGKLKLRELTNSFFDAKTLAEKETIFAEIEANYPSSENIAYAARSMATEKFKEGNLEAFNKYANIIKDANSKASLYNGIAWDLAEKGEQLPFAAKISKSSLDLISASKKDLSAKPDYFTTKQYVKSTENTYNMYADTYAFIQHKLGNTKEAIKYQKVAVGEGNDTELNTRYIDFLVADKQYKLASEKAKEFLSNGKGDSKMKDLYKTAYTTVNPEAKDFDKIIEAINKTNHDKELAELKDAMLDEEAPDFSLKNLNGETISLASLKGKTVILDFWATWCGPCKASFPAMQEVVEKYKDNDNVVLLFVDTFEDGKNREKNVAKFIADNKYDFHVLIDEKVKDTDNYNVANKYGITGIPTKIIIGPSGKINFKAVGYSGNNDQLKQEMDLMIDLLKS